jgi:hypothetical protein
MQLFVQSEAEYEKFAEVSRVLHLAVNHCFLSSQTSIVGHIIVILA